MDLTDIHNTRALHDTPHGGFSDLTPERILKSAESALEVRLTGMVNPLPSYINRVYELRGTDGTKFIIKFYRTGRWSDAGIRDEHRYIAECAEAEVPVVMPLQLAGGESVNRVDGICFSIFPKKAGRQFEINSFEDWVRIGSLLGRMHAVGCIHGADDRIRFHPRTSTVRDVAELVAGGFVKAEQASQFTAVCDRIVDRIEPLFEAAEFIRVHGDFHFGNVLDRLDEGLIVIDFDDMAMAPPVQDFWLLLPDIGPKARAELEMLIEGYEQFRSFDRNTILLIEPLRAMRMIYFLAWCSRQIDDHQFRSNFPGWGGRAFWSKEIDELETQLRIIEQCIEADPAP